MSQQPTPALTPAERQFLRFALDLAADHMATRGDEFDDEDDAALARLRQLADEKLRVDLDGKAGKPVVHISPAPRVEETIRNIVRRGPGEAGMTL
ncbi:hypothetical protein [Streptomyces xanthophaeus]|uniref:hypothetical protein n=1 Tax=Streptomyces xanthophaeus TaxID=67385 RepID=UPI0036668454